MDTYLSIDNQFNRFSDLPIIEGIDETTILLYFTTINAEDFQETAALFAEEGVLYPPFDAALVGREAIKNYLKREAKGMKLIPHRGTIVLREEKDIIYKVMGHVQTPLFSVNVAWVLILNEQSEILLVKVKLLAKLEELLHLKTCA